MISVKDTRNNLAELLEQVAVGNKQFVITKFGKPKAQLSPLKKEVKVKRARGNLPGFGMWADRKEVTDSGEWVVKMRKRWLKRSQVYG